MSVQATKYSLLITLFAIIDKGNSHYCVPHVDTILVLLAKYHKTVIKRRWLFQCFRDLEDEGLISRKRRWKKLPGPEIRSDSSIWWFTLKGIEMLSKKMVARASILLQRMRDWLRSGDKRSPSPDQLTPPGEFTDRKEALARVQSLINSIL